MPLTTDFLHGIDPTAFTTITGAQLAQLVDSATPQADKGMVIITYDNGTVAQPPFTTTTSKWSRYVWLRVSPISMTTTLYTWNPYAANPDQSLLNWHSVATSSIAPGSVTGTMIANSTITADKIISINKEQVSGYLSLLLTSSPFIGDVSGTQGTALVIGADKISSGMIKSSATVDADRAITTNHIKAGVVTLAKLDTTGLTTQRLAGGGIGIQPAWVTNNTIITGLANAAVNGSNDGQLIAVDSGSAGTFKYVPVTVAAPKQVITTRVCTTPLSAATTSASPIKVVGISGAATPSFVSESRPTAHTGSGTTMDFPFDTTYTSKGTNSTIIVDGNFCLGLTSLLSNAARAIPVLITLYNNGTTLLGAAAFTLSTDATIALEKLTAQFKFKIANISPTTYSLSLNIATGAVNGVYSAVGVGLYYSTTTTLNIMHKTTSTPIVIDAGSNMTTAAANAQSGTINSGYIITEYESL